MRCSGVTVLALGATCLLVSAIRGDEARRDGKQQATAYHEAVNVAREDPPVQAAEQRIRELEQQTNAAVVSGDLRVFEELLADDFTHTNQAGIFRTRAQWLANHKPGHSPYTRYDVDELKIRVYGETAVVTARTTPQGQDSRGKPITGQYRYLRVWAKRDGKWRAVAFQGTRISP
jgi:ketosteroid isomerase-like protein